MMNIFLSLVSLKGLPGEMGRQGKAGEPGKSVSYVYESQFSFIII